MKASSETKSMAPTAIHAHHCMKNSCYALPLHGIEEIGVGLRVLHLVQQELDRSQFIHRMQKLAQDPHLGQLRRLGDEFFLARAGSVDVDRREYPFFRNAPITMDFRIAGALEFL